MPIRSADNLREILDQVVESQQRLRGGFRGFGFKVIPRVSHLLKLDRQERADWRRDRKRGGGRIPSWSTQWSTFGWDQQVREERANKTGSGPPSRGPETTRVRADQCWTRHSGLEMPGGSAQRWGKGGAHVRSGHPNPWGSDITGCPAVSRRRAVTAVFQGLPTQDCHDSNGMPSVRSGS